MTRQRQMILEELKKAHAHPPADEIYERVRRHLPHISLGTVYRNLDTLCEHGLVRKLEYAGFQRRYDVRLENHYHVRCVRCGNVEDVDAEPLGEVERDIRKRSEYTIIGHRLEFIGYCPACRDKLRGPGLAPEKEKEDEVGGNKN